MPRIINFHPVYRFRDVTEALWYTIWALEFLLRSHMFMQLLAHAVNLETFKHRAKYKLEISV